jgi:hypothetical protein
MMEWGPGNHLRFSQSYPPVFNEASTGSLSSGFVSAMPSGTSMALPHSFQAVM